MSHDIPIVMNTNVNPANAKPSTYQSGLVKLRDLGTRMGDALRETGGQTVSAFYPVASARREACRPREEGQAGPDQGVGTQQDGDRRRQGSLRERSEPWVA